MRERQLHLMVWSLYVKVLRDENLAHYFRGVDVKQVVEHQYDMFNAVLTGNPPPATDLAAAHARLHIKNADFDRLLGHVRITMADYETPEGDIDRLIAVLDAQRSIVLGPPQHVYLWQTAWSVVRQAARYIGRRGVYLLFLAILDGLVAYSLTQPVPAVLTRAALYKPFIAIMPLRWWAFSWGVTALVLLAGVAWRRMQPYAFAAAAALMVLSGSGYVLGYLEHDPLYSRAYQTAFIYLAFAGMTLIISGWNENQR